MKTKTPTKPQPLTLDWNEPITRLGTTTVSSRCGRALVVEGAGSKPWAEVLGGVVRWKVEPCDSIEEAKAKCQTMARRMKGAA